MLKLSATREHTSARESKPLRFARSFPNRNISSEKFSLFLLFYLLFSKL